MSRPTQAEMAHAVRVLAVDPALAKMIEGLAASYPAIPLGLDQDHGADEGACATARPPGFTSVTRDGSMLADAKTAADDDCTVAATRRWSTWPTRSGYIGDRAVDHRTATAAGIAFIGVDHGCWDAAHRDLQRISPAGGADGLERALFR